MLDELERAFDVRVDGRAVSFGSWAGSDMDGHPEVGAEVLARTLVAAPPHGAAAAAHAASTGSPRASRTRAAT